MTSSSSVLRKKTARAVKPQMAVNRIMGQGSSIWLMTKLKEEASLAAKLQTPMAVAANRVGKKN